MSTQMENGLSVTCEAKVEDTMCKYTSISSHLPVHIACEPIITQHRCLCQCIHMTYAAIHSMTIICVLMHEITHTWTQQHPHLLHTCLHRAEEAQQCQEIHSLRQNVYGLLSTDSVTQTHINKCKLNLYSLPI